MNMNTICDVMDIEVKYVNLNDFHSVFQGADYLKTKQQLYLK